MRSGKDNEPAVQDTKDAWQHAALNKGTNTTNKPCVTTWFTKWRHKYNKQTFRDILLHQGVIATTVLCVKRKVKLLVLELCFSDCAELLSNCGFPLMLALHKHFNTCMRARAHTRTHTHTHTHFNTCMHAHAHTHTHTRTHAHTQIYTRAHTYKQRTCKCNMYLSTTSGNIPATTQATPPP
jgi:ABC-type nickel/cobalt efflux system permease component RcnA